jgi:multiple sugar transport system substrate-binding protein
MQRRGIKRLVLTFSLAAVLALAYAAVAFSVTAKKAPSKFGVNATGTVVFYQRNATDQAAAKLVPEFNSTHPHLKVVVTETCPNCDTSTLATAIRAGNPPDLVGLNDIDVPEFSSEGALMNLTKYVDALPYKKYLSPGHLALAEYKGKYYGVPYLGDLSVLWYNKSLFSQAGLNPNDPPTTFAQILSDAQAINKLGNGINGFSFAGDCQGCLGFVMEPDLFAIKDDLITGPIGHQKINITGNSALTQLLQLYEELYAQKLTPTSDLTDSGPTWGEDFESGKIGILPGDYGFIAGIKAAGLLPDVGIAPLPGPDGKYSTFDGGDDFVIPKGAKNASGAWEFVQWMLQKSVQEQYPSLGETPVRTDVINSPGFASTNPQDAVALKALKYGAAPVTLIYNAAFNNPNSPWYQMFTQAVYNDNISGALQTGQAGFQAALAAVGNK